MIWIARVRSSWLVGLVYQLIKVDKVDVSLPGGDKPILSDSCSTSLEA